MKTQKIRTRGWSKIPHELVDRYAPILGHKALAVYISMKSHANKEGISFPSNELIAHELKMCTRSVIRSVKILKDHNLISVQKKKNVGRWSHNIYLLLHISEWKRIPCDAQSHGKNRNSDPPGDTNDQNHMTDSHRKENHIKNNRTEGIKEIKETINQIFHPTSIKIK